MKKVLLATSALVAFAGAASAEIAMKGYARFGAQYTENAENEVTIDRRFNIDITGTGTSDNGLSFAAKTRIRSDETAATGAGNVAAMNGPRYSVSAGGMELAVGNIYGAIDSMSGLYAGTVGLTGLGFSNVVSNFGSHTYASTGAGLNGVELTYSVGDLSLHISSVRDADTEVAVGYAMNGVNVAVAFSNTDTAENAEWVATIGTKVGGVGVGFAAAQSVAGNTSMTLSGSFAAGAATSVNVYLANDEGQAEETAYGIGVVHNLGGGASVRGGFASTHGTNRADLGVQFNF